MNSSGAYIWAVIFWLTVCFSVGGYEQALSAETGTGKLSKSHADYSVLELEALSKVRANQQKQKGLIFRYKDTVDGGDDPMKAGCHLTHGTKDCSDKGVHFGADQCVTGRKLMEYTNSACHERDPIDLETHDCKKVCQRKGFSSGICRIVWNACAGNPSAKCTCTRRPVTP